VPLNAGGGKLSGTERGAGGASGLQVVRKSVDVSVVYV